MKKKYILTDETINHNGHILHRIKAVRSFGDVKEGDLGGWIEKEDNLSHDGDCWVGNEAIVCENANVSGDAWVHGGAKVYDNAKVQDNALVYGYANVQDNADVSGYARVFEHANVFGNAKVMDNAFVFGGAYVYDNAKVQDNAEVYGDAKVNGYAKVFGNARIHGDAVIESHEDYIVFKNFWSSGRYFTWTRSNDMWSVGCFYGNGEELIEKAYKDSEESGKHYEAFVKYVELLKNENFYFFNKLAEELGDEPLLYRIMEETHEIVSEGYGDCFKIFFDFKTYTAEEFAELITDILSTYDANDNKIGVIVKEWNGIDKNDVHSLSDFYTNTFCCSIYDEVPQVLEYATRYKEIEDAIFLTKDECVNYLEKNNGSFNNPKIVSAPIQKDSKLYKLLSFLTKK